MKRKEDLIPQKRVLKYNLWQARLVTVWDDIKEKNCPGVIGEAGGMSGYGEFCNVIKKGIGQ